MSSFLVCRLVATTFHPPRRRHSIHPPLRGLSALCKTQQVLWPRCVLRAEALSHWLKKILEAYLLSPRRVQALYRFPIASTHTICPDIPLSWDV